MNVSVARLCDLIERQEALVQALNLAIHEQRAITKVLFPEFAMTGGSLRPSHLATAGDVLVMLRAEHALHEQTAA